MNINSFSNEVYNILSNVKLVLLSEISSIEIKNIDESKFQKFYKDLNNLYKKLEQIKDNNILIHGFIDKYNDELRRIKGFLLQRKDQRSRSIHDKIFKNILKIDKYMTLGITQIFEDFIKGITYFSDNIENKKKMPIYHRAASCGNSSDDFQKKFMQCYMENNEITLKTKREHISKCYLERLIYDKIYLDSILHFPTRLNNELKQNKGHIFQLTERAKNFNQCFLGLKIEIDLLYELGLPCYLTIQYIKDSNIIKNEEYSKIIYIDDFGVKRYADKTILKITNKDEETKIISRFFDINLKV
jgi:hypothetical protein